MSSNACLGIDIGGTKTLCLLVSDHFEILEQIKFKTEAGLGQKRFTSELLNAVRHLKQTAKRKRIPVMGVGIGCAGQVDPHKQVIRTAPNILFLEGYAAGKIVEEAVGLKTVLGNDVHLGLYGEHQVGVAKGCSHVLGVFFGTGVGGAAIVNGRLYEGASGLGGQVGCVLAQPVGGPAAAQSHGIIDRIASKGSIGSEALQLAIKNWAPYLHKKVGSDLSKMGWEMIRKAISNGDQRVEEMLRARMQVVGIALSNIVNFLNPEMLVLGGGLVDELPKLVQAEIEDSLRKNLVPEVSRALRVKRAKLGGQAVAVGAAKLAFVELGV